MTTTTSDRHRTIQLALFTVGAVLMPSGLIAVGLGWYGAAHTRYAYDQFPYLLSGGLLGVCLTTLGGFLYFGAWQAKAAADQKSSIKQLSEAMFALAESRQQGEAAVPTLDRDADPGGAQVLAGPEGVVVHRRDCLLIRDRDDLRPPTGNEPDLSTCRICSPDPA